jgi:hypothetical protein
MKGSNLCIMAKHMCPSTQYIVKRTRADMLYTKVDKLFMKTVGEIRQLGPTVLSHALYFSTFDILSIVLVQNSITT